MKKLATLLLAAGMVLGSFAGAQAIDFKAKGEWIFEYGYTSGVRFANNSRSQSTRNTAGALVSPAARATRAGNGNGMDNFEAISRVRLQLDAVASESLSGQVFFELGNYVWGRAATAGGGGAGVAGQGAGGALGTDGVSIEVRRAFIDWIVPNTDLRVRMGAQGMALPSFSMESGVFNDDVAGISASYKINSNVSVAAFWARPYNDNYAGTSTAGARASQFYMDNVDAFGVVVPLSFDGVKITPWGMLSFIGPNALNDKSVSALTARGGGDNQLIDWPTNQGFRSAWTVAGNPYGALGGLNDAGDQRGNVINGLYPAVAKAGNRQWNADGSPVQGTIKRNGEYATAWWAGLTGEITAADPLRIAWDANYGSVSYTDTTFLNRSGWFLNLLVEYKLDWGVPGIYGWWGSGDDGDIKNGSERMPVFSINNSSLQMSYFGFSGGYFSGLSDGTPGLDHTGTWGIGARIRDMSFIEDLTHTLRVNFFGGTNDPKMAKYILNKARTDANSTYLYTHTDFNSATGGNMGTYLTRLDTGLEVNLENTYKIYENLDMMVELGYIHLWLDQSRGMWGSGFVGGDPAKGTVRGVSVTDAVKASIFFKYSF